MTTKHKNKLINTLLLLIIITFQFPLASLKPLKAAPTHALSLPLSTSGSEIIDSNGETVIMQGINWYGFETTANVVHALWLEGYDEILNTLASGGYNTIRLPFAYETIYDNSIDGFIDTTEGDNAALNGLTPLQAMDKIIQEADALGISVILDNHKIYYSTAVTEELWYDSTIVTQADWIDMWELLANRYKNYDNIIGADLKNEPHGAATWGSGNTATDWNTAATAAGNAILAIEPEWLIIVEGIGNQNNTQGHWWGGNLERASSHPINLTVSNKLVYSAHEYGPEEFNQSWFSDGSFPNNLESRWDTGFGYLVKNDIAPVLIGEFGSELSSPEAISWYTTFIQYLKDNEISWTYWTLNGIDAYGILNTDFTALRADRQAYLTDLMTTWPSNSGSSGGGSEGGDTDDLSSPSNVYRFYNIANGSHFYTNSVVERNSVLSSLPSYIYENRVYSVDKNDTSASVPVYRFYNVASGSHFYTNSSVERDSIRNNLPSYIYEGIVYYVYTNNASDRTPLYRFYNASNGTHFYTISAVERDSIRNNLPQYYYEGIAYYVLL